MNKPSFQIKNATLWEKRAQEYPELSIQSVMFRFLPDEINYAIHQWQAKEITAALKKLQRKKKSLNVLDVGCGYGRLSKAIIKKYPNTKLTGLDVSATFIKHYKKFLGKGVTGITADLEKYNFKSRRYDVIIVTGVLIYLHDEERVLQAITKIKGLLKKDGIIIISENAIGAEKIYTGFGVLKLFKRLLQSPKKRASHTGDRKFSVPQMTRLITSAGLTIHHRAGIPRLTFSLPWLVIVRAINKTWFRTALKNALTVSDDPTYSLFMLFVAGVKK